MRFHIKERAWSLPEVCTVRDDGSSAVFEIRGVFVNIDDDLVLIDRSTSQELARAHIRQHLPSLALHYEIYRNGKLWADIHDRFRLSLIACHRGCAECGRHSHCGPGHSH